MHAGRAASTDRARHLQAAGPGRPGSKAAASSGMQTRLKQSCKRLSELTMPLQVAREPEDAAGEVAHRKLLEQQERQKASDLADFDKLLDQQERRRKR